MPTGRTRTSFLLYCPPFWFSPIWWRDWRVTVFLYHLDCERLPSGMRYMFCIWRCEASPFLRIICVGFDYKYRRFDCRLFSFLICFLPQIAVYLHQKPYAVIHSPKKVWLYIAHWWNERSYLFRAMSFVTRSSDLLVIYRRRCYLKGLSLRHLLFTRASSIGIVSSVLKTIYGAHKWTYSIESERGVRKLTFQNCCTY